MSGQEITHRTDQGNFSRIPFRISHFEDESGQFFCREAGENYRALQLYAMVEGLDLWTQDSSWKRQKFSLNIGYHLEFYAA